MGGGCWRRGQSRWCGGGEGRKGFEWWQRGWERDVDVEGGGEELHELLVASLDGCADIAGDLVESGRLC